MAEEKYWQDALRGWSGKLPFTYEGLTLAALMSIHQELQKLNRVFGCPNVQVGFRALRRIARQDEAAFKRRVEAAAKKRAARQKNP